MKHRSIACENCRRKSFGKHIYCGTTFYGVLHCVRLQATAKMNIVYEFNQTFIIFLEVRHLQTWNCLRFGLGPIPADRCWNFVHLIVCVDRLSKHSVCYLHFYLIDRANWCRPMCRQVCQSMCRSNSWLSLVACRLIGSVWTHTKHFSMTPSARLPTMTIDKIWNSEIQHVHCRKKQRKNRIVRLKKPAFLPKIFIDWYFWPDSHEIVLLVFVFLEVSLVLVAFNAVDVGELCYQIWENVSNFFIRLIFHLQMI